ncbi:electron transfer flavoprotein beta subunit lysine methyltransferase-like isoform X3 [Macrobrachium nipponense]|uniref:electron transfer flavoprotein beta subunit lysine methyltransferase-like isoform X3 n=1 Tax=Macrobrachium nipponense TaxID=159736 RepID=UPI0030C8A8AD
MWIVPFFVQWYKKTYRDHILAETDLSRDHLTPEIQLYLITQNCRLWRARPEDSPFCEPFWAFYWPGGQALSRYLLDNKAVVKGKRVLDFGTGCGASGLAAKLSGAGHVTFNDIDPIAAEVVLLNGTENKIDIDNFSTVNLIGSCCQNFEVLLVGDMLYDTEFADEVLKWLRSEHEKSFIFLQGICCLYWRSREICTGIPSIEVKFEVFSKIRIETIDCIRKQWACPGFCVDI